MVPVPMLPTEPPSCRVPPATVSFGLPVKPPLLLRTCVLAPVLPMVAPLGAKIGPENVVVPDVVPISMLPPLLP